MGHTASEDTTSFLLTAGVQLPCRCCCCHCSNCQTIAAAAAAASARWYPKILKTRDPLILSVGWRRFQVRQILDLSVSFIGLFLDVWSTFLSDTDDRPDNCIAPCLLALMRSHENFVCVCQVGATCCCKGQPPAKLPVTID